MGVSDIQGIRLSNIPETPNLLFERIYHDYLGLMAAVANDVLHDSQDVEDALQDAFFAIAKNIETLNGREEWLIKAYVCKAAKNSALNILKKKRNDTFISDIEDYISIADVQDIPEEIENKEQFLRLLRIIQEMTPIYRDVMLYHYVYEMSAPQIAEMMCLPLGTVKTQLKRGKKLFLRAFKEGKHDEETE